MSTRRRARRFLQTAYFFLAAFFLPAFFAFRFAIDILLVSWPTIPVIAGAEHVIRRTYVTCYTTMFEIPLKRAIPKWHRKATMRDDESRREGDERSSEPLIVPESQRLSSSRFVIQITKAGPGSSPGPARYAA